MPRLHPSTRALAELLAGNVSHAATVTVTTTNDRVDASDQCSLRETLGNAIAAPGLAAVIRANVAGDRTARCGITRGGNPMHDEEKFGSRYSLASGARWLLLVAFSLFVCMPGRAQGSLAGTYTVGPGQDFETLSEAISTLRAGTVDGDVTFQIAAGTYQETLDLSVLNNGTHMVRIVGEDRASTVLQPLGNVNGAGIEIAGSNHIALERFTLNMDGISDTPQTISSDATRGIAMQSASDIHLDDVSLIDARFMPATSAGGSGGLVAYIASSISMLDVSHISVRGSSFSGAGTHHFIGSFEDLSFIDNEYSNFGRGISNNNSTDLNSSGAGLLVQDCRFAGPSSGGLNAVYISGNAVSFPEVTTYTTGVVLRNNDIESDPFYTNLQPIHLAYTVDAIIQTNRVRNGYYGLWVANSPGLIIDANDIRTIGYRGIYLVHSDRASLINNIVVSESYSALVLENSNDVRVLNNTFFSEAGSPASRLYNLYGDEVQLKNNIFAGGPSSSYALSLVSCGPSVLTMDNNLYSSDPANALLIESVAAGGEPYPDGVYATLADWASTQSGVDQNSQSFLPEFVSSSDFHIINDVDYRFGVFLPDVAYDIDSEPRVESEGVDVGADQYVAREDTIFVDGFETGNALGGSATAP